MNKSQDITDTIRLYKSHNVYDNLSKDDVAQHILPSVALNQYKVFRYDNTGVAYAFTNWAFLNNEAQENYKQTGVLNKFDWDSGKNCWQIDTVNTAYNKLTEIYNWTASYFSKILTDDEYFNWLRLDNTGQKVKRINKLKASFGKRKFLKE
jgi:hemolysin-activating ACP:hemolysin acyltransferase